MVVLWLIILRRVAIEFRSHQDHPLWRELWDTVFSTASALLAVAFGTTLGNLVCGVPQRRDGLPGLLDWYKGLVGLFTLATLAGHGDLYLAWRTEGPVRERSLALARGVWKSTLVLWGVATVAAARVRPDLIAGLAARPWTLAFVTLAFAGPGGPSRACGGAGILLRSSACPRSSSGSWPRPWRELPVLAPVDARSLR